MHELVIEMEFHHTLEQVPEEMRKNIRIGSVISGICLLSADAAIDEYGEGIVKDFDHDLRLLRYTLQKGQAERLCSVLAENCIYETDTSGNSYRGPDAIIGRFNYVAENHKGEYFAHLAEITEIDEESLEFPVGTRCIVLAADEEDRYESIVFMTADQDGNITRIKVSTDSRYHFRVEHPEKIKTPLDDIEVPESVAEPIFARARIHGFIDRETSFDQITEDPSYSSHADNAKKMFDALRADHQPDVILAVKYVFGFLFAKAVEMTVNERYENPEQKMWLLASYSPYDALRGQLATTLEPEKHAKLENVAELAQQFGNDMFSYMEMAGKTEEDFEETFMQAAIVIQRIGQLYADNGFERAKEDC